MVKRRQHWSVGDVFSIPTSDGKLVVGQVIGVEPDVLSSATVALFDERYESAGELNDGVRLAIKGIFSVLFVTKNHLKSGEWSVVCRRPVQVNRRLFPYESTRNDGFVGAKVIGSGIVTRFVNAFYGLEPWDDWQDPEYLDTLLISKNAKPLDRLIYKR